MASECGRLARFRCAIAGSRAGGTPVVPAGSAPAYSHFIHLKKKYGSTAASSISTSAIG
jgi:hypothetical protein